jgi:hypothetical protein
MSVFVAVNRMPPLKLDEAVVSSDFTESRR